MAIRPSVPWALLLTVVALTLPAPAFADHGVPFLDDRLATYMGIAQDHWGGPVPTCVANGTTLIAVHADLYDDPEPDVAARSDQPGCRISIDRSHWRSMRAVEACTIIVHEWGHLLGHGHSEDPLDLMAEFPERPPTACAALRPAGRAARAAGRRIGSCARGARHARSAKRAIKRVRSGRRLRSAKRGRHTRRACVRRARA
jgi:hypothetical protein